jgi:GxxExxY protein
MNCDEFDHLSGEIIGAAIEVHRVLGPGLLESAYEDCLAWELTQRRPRVTRQTSIPVRYKELRIDEGYRADMVVNEAVILELKCVDSFQPIHIAQVLTYLKMTDLKLGLLLNFKVDIMRNGIKRVVNKL